MGNDSTLLFVVPTKLGINNKTIITVSIKGKKVYKRPVFITMFLKLLTRILFSATKVGHRKLLLQHTEINTIPPFGKRSVLLLLLRPFHNISEIRTSETFQDL